VTSFNGVSFDMTAACDKPASEWAAGHALTHSSGFPTDCNRIDNTTAKTVKQETEREGTPSATQSTPVSDEGCHHSKDSDA
jgi:hypothetical protein